MCSVRLLMFFQKIKKFTCGGAQGETDKHVY
jgi:hypothetical protein